MNEQEYTELDGLGLAERVAAGEVSAARLLELAEQRADRLDPRINAIWLRTPEHARSRVEGPPSGPFAGVPFLLKDLHQDLDVQFVGRLGAEGLLLRLARELEQAQPWAARRPPVA